LGSPNFDELPINAPLAQAHNNQRDGLHRHTSIAGEQPTSPTHWQAGARFKREPQGSPHSGNPSKAIKCAPKPERFADHYTQARLFWNSQTPSERAHIVRGFRFELTKVQNAMRDEQFRLGAAVCLVVVQWRGLPTARKSRHVNCTSDC
jgi:catalase